MHTAFCVPPQHIYDYNGFHQANKHTSVKALLSCLALKQVAHKSTGSLSSRYICNSHCSSSVSCRAISRKGITNFGVVLIGVAEEDKGSATVIVQRKEGVDLWVGSIAIGKFGVVKLLKRGKWTIKEKLSAQQNRHSRVGAREASVVRFSLGSLSEGLHRAKMTH